MRDVAANGLLAAAGVDDARIGRRDSDRADRPAEKAVGDRLPRLSAVSGLPYAAATRAEVVDVALTGGSIINAR